MIRFGLFAFDPVSQQLLREGRVVALEPQPARALALLLSRPGEVISKEELRQAVWGSETHVDFERGLAYVLSQIRTALGDSGTNPRFVQTIPRQGYKFIAPVEADGRTTGWPRRRVVAASISAAAIAGFAGFLFWPARPKRLAVSIFDNETGNPAFDRWTHSLTDEVVLILTGLDSDHLAIIGNAAPLRRPRNIRNLKKLAQELDVDYVLLGQLKENGAGLRFITHLIELPGETHLKANRLDGDAADLGTLQQEVTKEFARSVRRHVLKRPFKWDKSQ